MKSGYRNKNDTAPLRATTITLNLQSSCDISTKNKIQVQKFVLLSYKTKDRQRQRSLKPATFLPELLQCGHLLVEIFWGGRWRCIKIIRFRSDGSCHILSLSSTLEHLPEFPKSTSNLNFFWQDRKQLSYNSQSLRENLLNHARAYRSANFEVEERGEE